MLIYLYFFAYFINEFLLTFQLFLGGKDTVRLLCAKNGVFLKKISDNTVSEKSPLLLPNPNCREKKSKVKKFRKHKKHIKEKDHREFQVLFQFGSQALSVNLLHIAATFSKCLSVKTIQPLFRRILKNFLSISTNLIEMIILWPLNMAIIMSDLKN